MPEDFSFDFKPFLAATGILPIVVSVLCLDASSSMRKHRDAPQLAVNGHLDTLRGDTANCHVTCLVTFADTYQIEIALAPIDTIPSYTGYRTGHGTLLYQTVKRLLKALLEAWNALSPEEQACLRIVVGVMSDGWDTRSSREHYPQLLQEVAMRAQESGLDLRAVGIGIDGVALARVMGFDESKASRVEASPGGLTEGVSRLTEAATRLNEQ